MFLAASAVVGLVACGREEVSHFRVPKRSPPPHEAVASASLERDAPAPPQRSGGASLRWTLPAGWTESAGGSMRFATFTPPVPGKIDASVVVLPGPAGGELANVNRWRGQIGLAPIDEAGLQRSRKVLKTKAGPFAVYDFASEGKPGSRLIAGLTVAQGKTWFVKITGDATAVAAARDDFMKLIGSLRFDESR